MGSLRWTEGDKPQFNRAVKCLAEMKVLGFSPTAWALKWVSESDTNSAWRGAGQPACRPSLCFPVTSEAGSHCFPLSSCDPLLPSLSFLIWLSAEGDTLIMLVHTWHWPKPVGPSAGDLLHVGCPAVLATYDTCVFTLFRLRRCVRKKKRI